ncbi:hypothetical protein [Bacillus sp. WP8]|nr:hypothetical protein [Bacillus sp. WP8]
MHGGWKEEMMGWEEVVKEKVMKRGYEEKKGDEGKDKRRGSGKGENGYD